MTIVFHPGDLLAALKRIKGVIPANPVLPVCSDFHFAPHADYVTITATDLDVTASVDALTSLAIEGGGDFTIEAAPLLKLVEAAENAPLIMEVHFGDNQHVAFTTNEGKYKLPIGNAEDYPVIPNYSTSAEYFYTNKHKLLPLFEKVSYALSGDGLRPAMTCIRNLVQQSGLADATATDAHRLGNAWDNRFAVDPENGQSEVYSETEEDIEILWSPKALKLLPKFLHDGIYQVLKNERQVFVASRDGFLCFQMVDSKYPDTKAIFPATSQRIESVRIEDLKKVIDRMTVVAPMFTRMVRMTFNSRELILSAEDFELSKSGTEKVELMMEIDQDTQEVITKKNVELMTVHVNIQSLGEALDNLEYQEGIVQFGINGPQRALTLTSFEELGGEQACERHLLMPINPQLQGQ